MRRLWQNKFDAALRAYKKGEYMRDTKAGQLLGLPGTFEPTDLQAQQTKRINDKVCARLGSLDTRVSRVGSRVW